MTLWRRLLCLLRGHPPERLVTEWGAWHRAGCCGYHEAHRPLVIRCERCEAPLTYWTET